MASEGLHALLNRASVGDAEARERAFSELLRLLAIFVRAGMGSKLRDHRESADVCQSIARSFFEDLGSGDISFPNEAAVVGYLKTVVRTKLALLARHDNTVKRGGGVSLVPFAGDQSGDGAPEPAANQLLPEGEELLRTNEAINCLKEALSHDEMELARLRLGGAGWDDISTRFGRDPIALRKQWSRLIDRLSKEMQK